MKTSRIHTFHFSDIRESILSNLEYMFNQPDYIQRTMHGSYEIIAAEVTDSKASGNKCQIGIILLDNGVLIETYFLNQPAVHNRLWMVEPYLGQISYMESTNPMLRLAKGFDITNPEGNVFELYANGEDLLLLNSVLKQVVSDIRRHRLLLIAPSKARTRFTALLLPAV